MQKAQFASLVTLFVLCAALIAAAAMAYGGINRNSDTLTFGGWLIALVVVGIAAAWLITGQNPRGSDC